MRTRRIGSLAAAGSTGNNTHASVPVPADAEAVTLEFKITAIGATPTVSWLFQGSDDDASVSDANSDWYPVEVLPSDAAAESAAVQTKTAVGVYESTLELARRPVNKVRLVVSANTNVTYEGEARAVELGE